MIQVSAALLFFTVVLASIKSYLRKVGDFSEDGIVAHRGENQRCRSVSLKLFFCGSQPVFKYWRLIAR